MHVHSVDPQHPAEASREALDRCAQALPRSRSVVVASVAWGASPGLAAAPWTIDGAVEAFCDRGWAFDAIHFARLGPSRDAYGVGRRSRLVGDASCGESEHTVCLSMPGVRRPLVVPRTWIGANLCLVAPLVHSRACSDERLDGPFRGALASLAAWCEGGGRDAAVGERLVGEIFAAAVVLIDGAWWSALSPDGVPIEIVAVGRSLASAGLGVRGAAEVLDDWIAAQLGLARSPRGRGPAPVVVSSETAGWPRVQVPRWDRGRGLGGRAVHALWRPDDGSRGRVGAPRRLLPPVPGPLARTWDTYSERPAGPS